MTPVEDLLAQATTIKNETVENNNSATRVGAWMEEVIPHLEQIANKAESGGSEKTLKTVDDEIVQLAGELSTLTEQPAGSFIYLSDLTSAFPTGNENVYLVKGNVKEVDTLTITGGATTSANFGVRLNNVTTYTSVLAGDSPDIVAQKIRSTVFVGCVWKWNNSYFYRQNKSDCFCSCNCKSAYTFWCDRSNYENNNWRSAG